MPGRKAKPPRLKQRKDGAWVIVDRERYVRTGCAGAGEDAIRRASEKLADYIGSRHEPAGGERDPDRLAVGDVLAAYADLKRPSGRDRETRRRYDELLSRLATINEFFGDRMVAELKSQACRNYVAWRTCAETKPGWPRLKRVVRVSTARRELEDLRAAIRAWHADVGLKVLPKIVLPAKAPARDRWLTRSEAGRLLAACLGFVWDPVRGGYLRDERGRLFRRARMVRRKRAHIARFVLLGIYSGRREATIRRTQWIATPVAPWLDLSRWIYHGRGRDERVTKKRRPPATIAYRLRPHLARWRKLDQALEHELGRPVLDVIHKGNGRPLADKIKRGWSAVLEDAGLGPEVVRHILKHTAATWLMQSGANSWAAAGFLGITVEQLEAAYGHHSPDFQDEAAAAFGGRKT